MHEVDHRYGTSLAEVAIDPKLGRFDDDDDDDDDDD